MARSPTHGRQWRNTVSAFAMIALILCAGGLAGPVYPDSFMDPLGPIAADQRAHLLRATFLVMIAVIPVFVCVPVMLIWFRRGNKRAKYRPNWHENRTLEVVMWTVPVLITIALAINLWYSTHKLDPYKPLPGAQLRVQVIGLDWKWLFIYPDQGIASIGELAIPTGRPVAMELTSDTVMQSFHISALAGQIYAMAGMRSELHMMAEDEGDVLGENMQYNGVGFTSQKFRTRAMDEADWGDWVAGVQSDGIALTDDVYARLGLRGSLTDARRLLGQSGDGPLHFTLASDNLFERVLARYHDGEALGSERQPGTESYDPELASLPLTLLGSADICTPGQSYWEPLDG